MEEIADSLNLNQSKLQRLDQFNQALGKLSPEFSGFQENSCKQYEETSFF
jgi:hypothetical protein